MLFLLLLIGVPLLELLAFILVGHAIGWLPDIILLLAISVLGTRLLRFQGRSAIDGVSRAIAQRRAPGPAVLDGALGFLGSVLLAFPGYVTDALGALLLLPPTRKLAHGWISRHYASRLVRFVAAAGRFAGAERRRPEQQHRAHHADVDSTAVDDDLDELGR
jgi:UPF0716 protein FxsA